MIPGKIRSALWYALAATALFAAGGCDQSPSGGSSSGGAGGAPVIKKAATDKPRLAYVTNGIASFWVIADVGARTAGRDLGVDVEVLMPPNGAEDQKRMLESLITRGVDGVAVSPIDPANQTSLLNSVAAATNLITHDSDAPKSKRLVYVGMDNYFAGRMCGELVKQAMPEGGSVMIFVGRIEQLNARLRRQGLIDELMDRSADSSRFDPPGQVVKGDKYTILDTRTDQFDFGKAKSLAEDAIVKYPDLGCMVGLFAYNPPKLLQAVKDAGKTGKIKIVGFDEEDGTLQGIIDGHIYGTVVQNPYEYGYSSIKILNALARGDASVIPAGGFIDIPARKIVKDNVQNFWDDLKGKLAAGQSPAK
jgi:ribose transport system substrate-binding protein